MEASYVLRILQQNGSTPELMDLKVEEGFIEQPDYIISSHWGWLLFIVLLACVALNLAGKGYILWFVNHMAQKRPLNTMITIDQMIQFIPALAGGVALIASIFLKGPIVNYVGDWGCEVLLDLNYIHILSQSLSSACMAMYRMIIYRFAHRISECKTIRNALMVVEMVLMLALLLIMKFARKFDNRAPLADFCFGRDAELAEIMHLYQGTPKEYLQLGKALKINQFLFTNLAVLAELICYIILYYWKYQDSRFQRNRNLTRRQNKLNSITMTGQSVTFALEIVYSIVFVQLILLKESGYHNVTFYYVMVYGLIAWTLMTWSQILASTDIRRYLFAHFE